MADTSLLRPGVGFRAKKRLGQHFLVDHKIIKEIIACAGFRASDQVLEIGPGKGALTLPLARSVGQITAVETDTRLTNLLKNRLCQAGITNVTLVNHDILLWDFREIRPYSTTKIKVIGNLPYNISSPFLEKLIENRYLVSRAVLMFQLEVAERLAASPGGKAYGALTLLVRYHAHTRLLLKARKGAFSPSPKVDSMVLELDFERPYPNSTVKEAGFKRVVKGAFSHRRKTVLNSLMGSFPSWGQEPLLEGMKKCGIDPRRRAENLDMDEFLCLASALTLTNGSVNVKEP